MPLDKVLHRIQNQIKDLAPTLELFVEYTVQPSVKDCEKILQQLYELQENLAVYKYAKAENELSPSFQLHAKVSEKEVPEKAPDTKEKNIQAPTKPEKANTQEKESTKGLKPLVIGLNDKFRFINELFAQNNSEYNIALEQFNNLRTWSDTEIYLNSLKNLYGWKENSEVIKYFYALIKKRFD
jgi:hypothetical protein